MELPCDRDTALELFTVWRDGHVMPRAGGYLDQPRWWRNLLRLFNSRYAPIHRQYMDAKYPEQAKPDSDGVVYIEDDTDDGDVGQPLDFGRLRGGAN